MRKSSPPQVGEKKHNSNWSYCRVLACEPLDMEKLPVHSTETRKTSPILIETLQVAL